MTSLQPIEHVRTSICTYVRKNGFSPVVEGHYVTINEAVSKEIAATYEAAPDYDHTPKVYATYSQLVKEIAAQFEHAVDDGYAFERWTLEGQPYQNSAEMAQDVRTNHHLFFFPGGEPHAFLDGMRPNGYTYNEMLRCIHDLYGHAAEGYGFGARGEENAWLHHSMMFSYTAQRALTTETRGQNSWVNFGPYSALSVQLRPFAKQKIFLLPEHLTDFISAYYR